jgi:hypothetical protein
MKAVVVMDQAAGTAGMTVVERAEPQAAINDVVVQVHASRFVPTELTWPSTWTDRLDRDRTPRFPALRVVRDRGRTPMRSSTPRTAWLSAERDTPTRFAARVKLRSSATARKAARTFKSSSCIGEWYSHPHADLTV